MALRVLHISLPSPDDFVYSYEQPNEEGNFHIFRSIVIIRAISYDKFFTRKETLPIIFRVGTEIVFDF